MISHRYLARVSALFLVGVLLTACAGGENRLVVTPASTPVPTDSIGLLVEDILAMAQPAWQEVTFLRTTVQTGPVPDEGAVAPFSGTVEDWTPAPARHIIEFQDGEAINEQIWVNDTVYMRGQFVSGAISPGLDINTWVIMNTRSAGTNTSVQSELSYLTRDQIDPYGRVSVELRNRPVAKQGSVSVQDRSCTLYTFDNGGDASGELRYELAIASNGLPCQLVIRANGFQMSTVYEYNLEVSIEAPLDHVTEQATPEG